MRKPNSRTATAHADGDSPQKSADARADAIFLGHGAKSESVKRAVLLGDRLYGVPALVVHAQAA